jgi:molybdopterin molybdotransferase
MRLFDAYIVVDWSALSKPGPLRRSPNAIWVGELLVGQSGELLEQSETYWRSRHACVSHLQEQLLSHTALDRRVFLGFDFAYGYPLGFATLIGLSADMQPWRQIWQELDRVIEDMSTNANNRFHAASNLNSRTGGYTPGPFWGCPLAAATSSLRPTGTSFPYTGRSGIRLERLRLTERHLPGVKSVWQLLGAGSVGSQT